VHSVSIPKLFLCILILKKPLSPQKLPYEFLTIQNSMPSSSPEAKPAQPKDAQDTSGAKDPVASDGGTEQEKQAVNDDGATAKVEASAPAVTKSQAAPAPVSSEKPPLPASDSTPAPASTDPEKAQADQDSSVPVTTAGVPAEPGSRVPDAQERWRKRRLLKIHTRLARFFNWILLVGFVILPSTFARDAAGGNHSSEPEIVQDAKSHIENHGVFAIGFFLLPRQWTRDLLSLVYQEGRPRMAIHQLIHCRTDQLVLRADIDVRELLRCEGHTARVVRLRHLRSCVFLYLRLRRAYHGLLSEAFTSQASARQQGFFGDGLKKV